jgi:inorganic pyrophosphatase
MTTAIHQLPARDPDSGLLNAVIETPKGSRNKYKYDDECGLWRLSKLLPLGSSFPFDFGFIPSTRGEDGDPLDVLVLSDEPSFPGCVVPARLIGVLEAEQAERGRTVRNDRLIAVVETPYNPPPFQSLEELTSHALAEIEHFFVSYNQMEDRQFKVLSREGPEKAEEILEGAVHAPPRDGAREPRRRRSRRVV